MNSIAQQFPDFTYWKRWVVSLHAKAGKLSVLHSPPTMISCRKHQHKLLYYFHITVEQGTVASLALPIFQLLAYCNSIRWCHTNVGYAQVHSNICCPGGPREDHFDKNTLHFYCHVCIFSYPSSCIVFWQLLGWETGNYYHFGLILIQVLSLVGILLMTFDLLTCDHPQEGIDCPSLHPKMRKEDPCKIIYRNIILRYISSEARIGIWHPIWVDICLMAECTYPRNDNSPFTSYTPPSPLTVTHKATFPLTWHHMFKRGCYHASG